MTRSKEPVPTWDENWKLLRQLWPSWEPTPETVRHVWFQGYDKPHAISGPATINQAALRQAIVETARSNRWKEPTFYEINNAYKRIKNEQTINRAKVAMRSKMTAEQLEIQEDHRRRMVTISGWSAERLTAARNHVAHRFSAFRGYSADPTEWSPFYTGMLIAGDQELSG